MKIPRIQNNYFSLPAESNEGCGGRGRERTSAPQSHSGTQSAAISWLLHALGLRVFHCILCIQRIDKERVSMENPRVAF